MILVWFSGVVVMIAIVVNFCVLVGEGVTLFLGVKIAPSDPPICLLFLARRDKPTPMSKIMTNNPTNNANTLLVLSI